MVTRQILFGPMCIKSQLMTFEVTIAQKEAECSATNSASIRSLCSSKE
jgi:hypothetical protein